MTQSFLRGAGHRGRRARRRLNFGAATNPQAVIDQPSAGVCGRQGVPLEMRKVLLGHKTGDITSHYSTPELAELIRATNAVLKAQESTLLRVVTKQLQVVSGESRAKVAQTGISAETGQERKLLTR